MNRHFYSVRLWLMGGLLMLLSAAMQAQSGRTPNEIALQYLQEHNSEFHLNKADVSDVRVARMYSSPNMGVTHVWLQQQYAGIPVFNGLVGLHIKADGSVYHVGHRFIADLASKVNTKSPSLSASRALEMAMADLGFKGFTTPSVREKINERNWVFEGGAISKSDIPVSACYELAKDGSMHLAWTMVIQQANTADLWNMRIDAQTGLVLDKINQTAYCKPAHTHGEADDCEEAAQVNTIETGNFFTPPPSATESYRIFPFPVESPSHGSRSLVVSPAIPAASPFGWHDVNGQAGPEYSYTRGNNVWAFDDSASDNTGSVAESADGGANLLFDFPFDDALEPAQNREAAITNLFYVNNMMHDLSYLFGFTEEAGNFEQNNHQQGGAGGDPVMAHALDGSGTDNANFSTPADGASGTMQMFLWSRQNDKLVSVSAPGAVQGLYIANGANGWGAAISNVPVTGQVVFVNDGTGEPTLGCNPPVNDVNGKIVMVDRGSCEFGLKALNVEEAGGIGCIICNFEDNTVNMGAASVGGQVTIPVVSMKKTDCDILRQYAGSTLTLSLVLPPVSGPDFLDGDFDNGIIAHEYAHGISNRLTGTGSGCLGNAEQMGEGWSDFFSLITTVKPGDVGTKKRGVGTFVFRQPTDAFGIRRYPYSTDMSINPLTFGSVAENTEVHALGEVWTAMIWDLYWAMVDKYGYDADWSNANSGNARAIQLVMDGMGMQTCNPGFEDGRDAIMLADILHYNAADTCLIMNVFARRGLGVNANQNSNDNAGDGVENFDPIPTCLKELKLKKTCTPTINPGETADFTITITNHKDGAATGVVVNDELPAGLTFVSASNGGTYNNNLVNWNIGTMSSGQTLTLTYQAKFANGSGSVRLFRDSLETDDNWLSLFTEGASAFELQTQVVKTGSKAWLAPEEVTETDMTVEYLQSVKVTGTKPAFRFWANFNTETSADAGFLEIRDVNESSWRRFQPEQAFRGGFTGKVQYGTFAIPYLSGYSGNSNGWRHQYLDLSEYIGKDVTFRFRFGSDDNTGVSGGTFTVDDLEMLDILNFDGAAVATSAEGDIVTANAPERGLIINPGFVTGVKDPVKNNLEMYVQPNPADDLLRVTVGQDLSGEVRINMFAMDGRVALSQVNNGLYSGQTLSLDIHELPAGVYTLRLENTVGSSLVKVVVE